MLPGDVTDEEFIIKSFQQAVSTFGELIKRSHRLSVIHRPKYPLRLGRIDLLFNVIDKSQFSSNSLRSHRSRRWYRMQAYLLQLSR
jgi:hypothetical protein